MRKLISAAILGLFVSSAAAQDLPDCEANKIIKVLIQIANRKGVFVYDVQDGWKTIYATPDMKLCAGSALTNRGVYYVKYNIRWINHETGEWWVAINSAKRVW